MLSSLNNLSVRNKVTLAFSMVCVVVIGLGLFAMQRLSDVNAAAADMRDNWMPSVKALGRIAQSAERYRANIGTVLVARDDRERADAEATLEKTRQALKKAQAAYAPLILPGEEQKLAAAFGQAWEEYEAGSKTLHDLVRKGDKAGAEALFVGAGRERMNRFQGGTAGRHRLQ